MASALAEHDEYMIILHGHANPTKTKGQAGYEEEIQELKDLSEARARTVGAELNKSFKKTMGTDIYVYNDGNSYPRVTVTGYGGEKTLAMTSSSYASLNRRVEMILLTIDTETLETMEWFE
jgi:outer membrane protein OmpA-like peptidoglycan-associated protein